MNSIQTTKEEVYKLLKTNPRTRDDDMYLYGEYLTTHWVRDTEKYRVFSDPIFRKEKGIAPFETVSRCRRNLQNDFMELNSDEEIKRMREAREEIFENYFGGGKRK